MQFTVHAQGSGKRVRVVDRIGGNEAYNDFLGPDATAAVTVESNDGQTGDIDLSAQMRADPRRGWSWNRTTRSRPIRHTTCRTSSRHGSPLRLRWRSGFAQAAQAVLSGPEAAARPRLLRARHRRGRGISTGGYLAGVLDFFVEALDEYAAAQAANPAGTPTHKVKLVNLTGTSAGGLSAALAATCLLKDASHVYDDAKWTALVAAGVRAGAQTPQLNPLYASWVQLVDLEGLLAAPTAAETDISVLAAAPCQDRRAGALDASGAPVAGMARMGRSAAGPAPDVRQPARRPYALNFDNVPDPKAGERLTLHRDQVAFSVSPDGADGAPDSWSLSGASFNDAGPAWTLFQAAAVSSSAIPGVFAPGRILGQNIDVYQWRDCWFDTELNAPVLDQPFWQTPPASFDFTATDGGLFDNEPFDVAHRALAGATAANPRVGGQANRAVVLVAPYVDDRAGDPTDPVLPPPPPPPGQPAAKPSTPLSRLASALWRIFNSPIDQSRWDAFDLALIKSEDVFSRYMIAPSRENPDTASPIKMVGPSRALMSWPLNLGLGFAAEAYRRHDYLLGRRNAQRFLSDSFMLPGDNPIINTADAWEPTDTRPGPAGSTTLFYPIVAAARRGPPEVRRAAAGLELAGADGCPDR